MNIYKCISVFGFLLMGEMTGFSQYISNPSFEAEFTGIFAPQGWSACNLSSTPDVQPIIGEVEVAPSHGNTYLGMAARGTDLMEPKNEGIQTRLLQEIKKDHCYQMNIDLAKGEVGDNLYSSYPNPMRLRAWGANADCSRDELFFETDYIDQYRWQGYTYKFIAGGNYELLFLEVIADTGELGYMILDNIGIDNGGIEFLTDKFSTALSHGEELILEASESPSYLWTPQENLSCYDCRRPEVINAESSQTYICQLAEERGCLFKELFVVKVEVFIPNVFTPNGDGINEAFLIDGLKPNSVLKVFDRRGRTVYENSDYQNDWNGEDSRNKPLVEDTYWYVLEIPGDLNRYKGYVYIKR